MVSKYKDTDAAFVAALLDAVPEVPSTSEESFRGFAGLSFNRGAGDFRILQKEELCIGLLTSTLLPALVPPLRHFRIVIHPTHRRRGLASHLMEVVEAQEALPGTVLQCNSQRSWSAGNSFLERHGFHVARTELLMRRSAAGPSAFPPSDITFRQATLEDDLVWATLHRQAYGHRDDFSNLTPDDLATERANPGFTLTVAERGGEVVGYCHGMDLEESEGLINSLVVRDDMRREGLGAALLASATATLIAQGAAQVSLNVVSDNEPAIRLYKKMGFRTYDEILTYHRALDRTGA